MTTLHALRKLSETAFEADIEWGPDRRRDWYRINLKPGVAVKPEFPNELYDDVGWYIRPLTEAIGRFMRGVTVELPLQLGDSPELQVHEGGQRNTQPAPTYSAPPPKPQPPRPQARRQRTYHYLVPIEEALHYEIFAGQTVYAFDGNDWVPYYGGADVTPEGLFARIETITPNLTADYGCTAPVDIGEYDSVPPLPNPDETIPQYVARASHMAAAG